MMTCSWWIMDTFGCNAPWFESDCPSWDLGHWPCFWRSWPARVGRRAPGPDARPASLPPPSSPPPSSHQSYTIQCEKAMSLWLHGRYCWRKSRSTCTLRTCTACSKAATTSSPSGRCRLRSTQTMSVDFKSNTSTLLFYIRWALGLPSKSDSFMSPMDEFGGREVDVVRDSILGSTTLFTKFSNWVRWCMTVR
jgi:hypothetical protein